MLLYTTSKHLHETVPNIAKSSQDEANLFVFITGRNDDDYTLGIAFVGTVCQENRDFRVSVNRYGVTGSHKNVVLYTAEVIHYFIT